MDHQAEPPAWLPQGAARGVTDEEAGASGEGQDAGGNEVGGGSPGAGPSFGGSGSAGSIPFGNEGAFGGGGSFGSGGSFGEAGTGETAGSTVPPGEEADSSGEDPISFEYPRAQPAAGPEQPGPAVPYQADEGYHTGGPYDAPSFGDESSYRPASYEYAREGSYTATAGSASSYLQPDSGASAKEDPMVRPYPGQAPYQGRPAGDTAALGPARPAATARGAARPRRRANLVISRLEPWSVMKFSFLMSLVAWVVLFVAVALLYFLLSALGVFHAVQSTLSSVTSSQGSGGFDLGKYISASRILGYTMLLGAVNIVLITALSTIGAMIYNLVTHLGGGIEITLKESD